MGRSGEVNALCAELRANVARRRRDLDEIRRERLVAVDEHCSLDDDDAAASLELSGELGTKAGVASFLRRAQLILEKRAGETTHDFASHAQVKNGDLWRKQSTYPGWTPVGGASVRSGEPKQQRTLPTRPTTGSAVQSRRAALAAEVRRRL